MLSHPIHHYLDCGLWKPGKRNKYLFLDVKTSKTHHQKCSQNSYQYCNAQDGNTKACKKYLIFRHNKALGEQLSLMFIDSKYYQLQLSKYIKKLRKQEWLGIIYQNINNKDQTICLKEGIFPRIN